MDNEENKNVPYIDIRRFGKIIRQKRKFLKLTMENLAEEIGISTNYMGKIERGEELPALIITYKIAEYFNISLDYLLSNKNLDNYSSNDIEYKIIEKIDSASYDQKEFILDFINLYLKYDNAKKGSY